jgi:hypothetical protein
MQISIQSKFAELCYNVSGLSERISTFRLIHIPENQGNPTQMPVENVLSFQVSDIKSDTN